MSVYRRGNGYKKQRRIWHRVGIVIAVVLLLVLVLGSLFFRWYSSNLEPVNTQDTSIQSITIDEGTSGQDAALLLEQEKLIRSATAYSLYTRLNSKLRQVQAGQYELSPSMKVSEIAAILSSGENTFVSITILPAQRIDQLRDTFVDAGYTAAEVEDALDPAQYVNHPALSSKPVAANLEGYLYPETFNVTPSTPLSEVVTLSLNETALLFTPEIRQELRITHGLSLYESVILASIVEREVNNPDDRPMVAQVFLKRYKEGISLGSDPTALYGALIAGIEPSVFADTPYNTRIYAGLPPGPINNISEESLRAVAYPSDTDFLFFVSGDDGMTYFSRTQAEHEALAAQHCIELCQSY